MNIEVLSKKVICSNDDSIHNYFAWPTVTRLGDGRLCAVSSGFRLTHRCPFGKVVAIYSSDEGKTWSRPAVLIDTPLDDRDGGIAVNGENVIVTSFNNGMQVQRSWVPDDKDYPEYRAAYLDIVERDDSWKKYLGSTFIMSNDGGKTFGDVKLIPVSAPHGPAPMKDGSFIYVGNRFDDPEVPYDEGPALNVYKVYADGSYEYLSAIEDIGDGSNSYEPHIIELESGKIIVHIRVQRDVMDDAAGKSKRVLFTIFQTESVDGGKTWTKPHRILSEKGGAPAHLLENNGTLISCYGYRAVPFGIRAAFSHDEGESWDIDNVIVDDGACWDIGYPSTVVLADGTMLTVYYGRRTENGPAVLWQVNWKYN